METISVILPAGMSQVERNQTKNSIMAFTSVQLRPHTQPQFTLWPHKR